MTTLKEAIRLCRLDDKELVRLRKWNDDRWSGKWVLVRDIRRTYDMKCTHVVWIRPRFELCGPEYEGMEFGLYEGVR